MRCVRALALMAASLFVPLTSALPARAEQTASSPCSINTGLDPACPETAVGIADSTTVLTETATLHETEIFGSWEFRGDRELTISEPVFEHLGITGVGDAFGTGDVAIGYLQAFGGKKRLTQVAGLSASFATGSTEFSAGSTELTPTYALSYALGNRISLVTIGQYTFSAGGTKLPFAPRTQQLTVIPRAIIDLSRTGLYAALELQGSNVTGEERYQAYQAGMALGIVRGHLNLAAIYGVPIARFTRDNVFYHEFGIRVSWQR